MTIHLKALQTTKDISPMVKRYYQEARRVKEQGEKPICFACGFLVELLWAMDMFVVYPENFAAACAAKQIAMRPIEEAERRGFDNCLCSYFRTAYGSMIGRENLADVSFPGGGLPNPDFIIGGRDPCVTHPKWWRLMGRLYQVPTFIVEPPTIPPRMRKTSFDGHFTEYIVAQFRRCISFIEEHTAKKLEEDKLEEAMILSNTAAELMDEIFEYRKAVPCPMGAEDMSSALFPIITYPGTQIAVDFYEKLVEEVKQRVENKEGALSEERFRLLYDGIPPWYGLGLFNSLWERGAIAVAETYTSLVWHCSMNPEKPLESLARKMMQDFLMLSCEERAELVAKMVEDYKIDGAILFPSRTCKSYSASAWHLKNLLQDKLGIPAIIIEHDQADARAYSEAQARNRLDAFFEMLEARRRC